MLFLATEQLLYGYLKSVVQKIVTDIIRTAGLGAEPEKCGLTFGVSLYLAELVKSASSLFDRRRCIDIVAEYN
jgi:hypothetical protein